ncbi:MAG: TlpA family protein disulfide reductase [Alphaproteobacteria bacterium]
MRKIDIPTIGMLVLALVMMPLGVPVAAADSPPVSGAVQNFIVFDEPVPAPLTPFNTNGEGQRTLEDFRGKVVLVNFWATWCGPCIRELPSIERLHAELAGDRFTVVLISQDRDWKRIGAYLKRLRVAGPESFRDDRLKFSRAMGVGSLPVSAIVDHEGNVVGNLTGHAEWDAPEALELIRHYLDRVAGAERLPVAPQRVGTGFSPE